MQAEKIYPPRPDVSHAEHNAVQVRLARCRDLLREARGVLAFSGNHEQLVQRIDAHLRRANG